MWVHLTPKSGNRKVGPIPVSTTEEASCPDECPFKGKGCYAKGGPLAIHWKQLSKKLRGGNWSLFCNALRKIEAGTMFRHNQAGDLPKNKKGKINANLTKQLVASAKHLRGWTYSHYDMTDPHNAKVVKQANEAGFTVNLSADNLTQADQYAKLGIGPVVVVLPENAPTRGNKTPSGLPIVVCPAQTNDNMSCAQCKLCQVRDRKSIVGFIAHGVSRKSVSAIVADTEQSEVSK